jgi:hypothetical protein
VALFQMLTGWAQEDLLQPLGAVTPGGGLLLDRLQDAVAAWAAQPRPDRLAACCLVRRNLPARTPPRIIVLCGPGGRVRALLAGPGWQAPAGVAACCAGRQAR